MKRNSKYPQKLNGRWKVARMGMANHLKTPQETSIIYHFKKNTLTIETPYKKAERNFQKINSQLVFEGEGLFGGVKSFDYAVSRETLTLKSKEGFVVTFTKVNDAAEDSQYLFFHKVINILDKI